MFADLRWLKPTAILFALIAGGACSRSVPSNAAEPAPQPAATTATPAASPTSSIPDLRSELLDDRNKTTASPLGKFDFKNFTYELPRGWQNPDGTTDIKLTNGHLDSIQGTPTSDEMSPEDKAAIRSQRRIGMTYVTTKYLDANGDGQDEAFVILKIETGGTAIPQIVYVFEWKNNAPELMWTFRTGDRADAGLKDLRMEGGNLMVELYGQDRFLLGGFETSKITGDEEQLCCPTYFTRTAYKWTGSAFVMQGKRLTFPLANPSAAPQENLGDIVNDPKSKPKK